MFHVIEVVVGLLVAVAGLAWLGRRIAIPYPILLVLGGLALGLTPGLPQPTLDPDVVFLLFLPPLLYPAALFTPWRDFRANLRPILLLAIGFVLFTTVAIGLIAHFFIPGLPLAAGFVLGAIVSPPDAIAATAIAERLRVPRHIVAILEGESLVNDATALVAYRIAIAAVVTGSFSLPVASVRFVLVGAGGILFGLAVGWLTTWLQKHLDDPPVQITVSLLTPFIAYLPADRLGVSGVLAVVTVGLYNGWRAPGVLSHRVRLQAGPIWEMIEFLLNGLVFILIGLQLPEVLLALSHYSVRQLAGYAILISLAVILVRILWVFAATYIPRFLFASIRLSNPYPPWKETTIIAWTGMRGVVSLAAALALPLIGQHGAPFPGRDLILFLTFTVILATLVVQGLSLGPIIRWLGVEDDRITEREERQARLKANQAALERLEELTKASPNPEPALQRLRTEYEDRIRQVEVYEPQNGNGSRHLFSTEYEKLSYDLLQVERKIILQLRNQRAINDEVLRRIQRDIDLAEARLRG